MRVYCEKCQRFTFHHFSRWPTCNQCRSKGHPILVHAVIWIPVLATIYAIYRLATGGGW